MPQTVPFIDVVDSHTGGEPTRVIVAGGPELGSGPLETRRELFRTRFDAYRRAVVCEPRGSEIVVGALLCPPTRDDCICGVIFFNNVGYLGMCGHGTIGVAQTLAHQNRIQPGQYQLETPVGTVRFQYRDDGRVTFWNVPSYRYRRGVQLEIPPYPSVTGDVAWGGNWFYLAGDQQERLSLDHVDALVDRAWRIRQALRIQGVTGERGAEIDHIELHGPPSRPDLDSRNFVLCPGKAYDRSPCGTGTSAKIACLVADGRLRPGQVWRQESIVGSVFDATAEIQGDQIIPVITGSAHVTAQARLWLDPRDPFCWGIAQ
jgi:4-hydroxyproline epimerase